MLSENGELILKNKEIANIFNDHFGSNVENLGLDHWDDHIVSDMERGKRIRLRHHTLSYVMALVLIFWGILPTDP